MAIPAVSLSRSNCPTAARSYRPPHGAEALLLPALSSCDPEVRWRLGDALIAQGRFEEAVTQLDAARLGFEELVDKHPLAFADHAAEFYSGSGNDGRRALELARMNAANRPTRRAVAQVRAIAAQCGRSSLQTDDGARA